ncbi:MULTISPECIES: DUF2868 domain-containing protein [Variovorax]|uniref:DUF2868 domain-containing protein n=1 Tax=Variovorax TaxID=34072 RepID=UPI00086D5FB5|nr:MULTISPECIES: DUF2868 domain-containing protein [Variovorax]MBN8758660.1 DUF2868 domain-containing protein [Variovorax sp.]ODU14218.1 MAG: hypothetical protein ABS94_23260 [Variovorax sp. SCN 67-85]ODV25629.1 MAG: hypothetical protein ABT25_09620 [Variovorax sp. SCN 67-20]OJZ08730.1 MAG: hypothetical protein BGP22_32735 [Variovorax sp. 67-131]UKI11116.1 DUF2868 domain-containing protein [Variovorax paradoxus]
MTNTAPREPAISDAVITEAIRWVEQSGPLDDAQAMRAALASRTTGITDAHTQIIERARQLGERIGLQPEISRARQWAPWVLIALVALIVMAGLGLAGNVVGGGERHINVVVALVSLLGLHALTLLLWLLGLCFPLGSFGTASLGWMWLSLTARVAGGKHGQAPVLLRAATGLLTRARLLPWAFGLVSHGIWSLSFIVVLGSMLFALAFRSYTLSWETTILDPAFFVRAVQSLGWAPAQLGFPVPDAATVLAAAPGAAGQRTWALWLTGCIAVYGLLPRLVLVLLSAAVWKRRRKALQPDWHEPYYRKLLARFAALAPAAIVDADPGRSRTGAPAGLPASQQHDGLFVIGFELPPDMPWPPAGLPLDAATRVERIDGSAPARRTLLDQLASAHPRTVLLACHAASSPDRGTERFLREVLAHCGECRLWLAGAPDATAIQRWLDWLRDSGLESVFASDTLTLALRPNEAVAQ